MFNDLNSIAQKVGAHCFKAGDIVECMNLDDVAGPYLEVGKRYEVWNAGYYHIGLKGVGIACVSKCFRKVEE